MDRPVRTARVAAEETFAGIPVKDVKGGGCFSEACDGVGQETCEPVGQEALIDVVRQMLPQAEACALGCAHLARVIGADVNSVVRILETEGLTIFKNELEFMGCVQPCVSVNKRLRAWVG